MVVGRQLTLSILPVDCCGDVDSFNITTGVLIKCCFTSQNE